MENETITSEQCLPGIKDTRFKNNILVKNKQFVLSYTVRLSE
jgi:hypothetical protein